LRNIYATGEASLVTASCETSTIALAQYWGIHNLSLTYFRTTP